MKKSNSEFTNLTRSEVEALLECFDLLRNGYTPVCDYKSKFVWMIRLVHRSNTSRITVMIYPHSYTIVKNGVVRKQSDSFSDDDRYCLMVHSDCSIEVEKLKTHAGVNLESG